MQQLVMTDLFQQEQFNPANDNRKPVNEWEEKFLTFHKENPQIYTLVVHFAKEAIAAGFKHYGMQQIIGRVRWHTGVETRDEAGFKINNNFLPYYSRMFHRDYPQYAGFFRTRKVKQENRSHG